MGDSDDDIFITQNSFSTPDDTVNTEIAFGCVQNLLDGSFFENDKSPTAPVYSDISDAEGRPGHSGEQVPVYSDISDAEPAGDDDAPPNTRFGNVTSTDELMEKSKKR